MENVLNEVYTLKEASKLYGLGESTLRSTTIKSKRLVEGIDFRRSGKVWLITKAAMDRLYKK